MVQKKSTRSAARRSRRPTARRHATQVSQASASPQANATALDTYLKLRPITLANHSLAASMGEDASGKVTEPPWTSFQKAHACASSDRATAIATLHEVLAEQQHESRVQLLAWNALRELGEAVPPQVAAQTLGIVVEVGLSAGLDVVAAYTDGSARFYHHTGGGIVWDGDGTSGGDGGIPVLINKLIATADLVRQHTKPAKTPHPPIPTDNMMLINVLTPAGIHTGHGSMNAITQDPMGGAVFKASFNLMQALITKTTEST